MTHPGKFFQHIVSSQLPLTIRISSFPKCDDHLLLLHLQAWVQILRTDQVLNKAWLTGGLVFFALLRGRCPRTVCYHQSFFSNLYIVFLIIICTCIALSINQSFTNMNKVSNTCVMAGLCLPLKFVRLINITEKPTLDYSCSTMTGCPFKRSTV